MATIQKATTPSGRPPAPGARIWKPRFIQAWRLTGCNWSASARVAGVGRVTAIRAAARDAKFREELEAIRPEAIESVEASLYTKALAGEAWAVKMFLQAMAPDKYRDRYEVDLRQVHRLAEEFGVDAADIIAEAEAIAAGKTAP